MTTSNELAAHFARATEPFTDRIAGYLGRRIERDGINWQLVGCNDLGVLYWRMGANRSKVYTLEGIDIADIDALNWL